MRAAASDQYTRVRAELLAVVELLLVRAQASGCIRTDMTIDEIDALLIGAARASEYAADRPDVGHRTLQIMLRGLERETDKR
ncbi:SbtR family transcriptional regulator [Nocardia sp. NPDC003963]